jgi:hypothetical protein
VAERARVWHARTCVKGAGRAHGSGGGHRAERAKCRTRFRASESFPEAAAFDGFFLTRPMLCSPSPPQQLAKFNIFTYCVTLYLYLITPVCYYKRYCTERKNAEEAGNLDLASPQLHITHYTSTVYYLLHVPENG